MEHHELAIAALDSVAQSSWNGRDTVKPSSSRNTGIDRQSTMDHNTIVDNTVNVQEPSQQFSGTSMAVSASGERAEDINNATSALPSTSSNNSQSTIDVQDASTPPTSISEGFSSQSTNQDLPMSQLSQLSQLAAAQQPLTSASVSRPNNSIAPTPTAGLKRTADGQLKQAHANSPPSPHVRGHSRTTSGISNASASSSRIGEISSELKVRLSYAMVKVNNGWQSNSIDEVESMASQAGSPTSSTSTLHGRRNLITSPRAAIANIQGQTSSISSNSGTPAPSGDFDLYSRSDQPHSTYITTIRDPEIQQAPTIPGQGSNSSIHSPNPKTPNRGSHRENPAIQTPLQKTIQEQDAIETLMFMSSPGNSGNMKHNFPPPPPRNRDSPLQSPLRTEFNTQDRRKPHGRKVGFEIEATSGSTGSSEAGGVEYRSRTSRMKAPDARGREEAIDRLLEASEESSSDEETLVLNYSSPRRKTIAAGRM
ncbi:hypothetical protein LHYA1_G007627 [Lachnellula hyalina]|uniref:Uncharacterized protein n=1 Tax=Lachnellula hyalina TaxID=1316788 RepID=A0A8H8TVQ2_9HELO|nr:uncharacterized protein LHYA1_G007627 [Lachnellula hyalina]TVY23622.1 hypothetical protein LHYA1_G007627 [Lachnellula hyalina]